MPQTPPARSAPPMDLSVEATDQREPAAACRRLQRHARGDRAAVVPAGVSRPRRQHGATDLARGADRLMPGSRAVADQSLHRSQGRLGLRRRHHGQHLVLCDLDELAQSRPRAHADDHPREQLHAVDGQLRRLFHRRHPGLGLCGLHHRQSPADVRAADAGLGVLHRRARGHDGHPHEAADDQYRAAALPVRHRGGRDLARAACQKLAGSARGQGTRSRRAHCRDRQGLGRRAVDDEREPRTLFQRGPADGPAEVAPRQSLRSLVGPHRGLFLGFHISRRRRHHRHAGLRDHARLGHVVLGCGRAGPPDERRHRRCGLRGNRAVDALVRRVLHGGRGTVELCAELAHGIERVPRSRTHALLALGGCERSEAASRRLSRRR